MVNALFLLNLLNKSRMSTLQPHRDCFISNPFWWCKEAKSQVRRTFLLFNRHVSEFDYIKSLGEGAFGRVYKVKEKLTEQDYAMKVIDCKE